MLTQQQIQLVKQSWKSFRSMDPVLVGDVFYSKLFLDHPRVQHLFQVPKEVQAKKLVDMITVIIGRLDRPETISADIRRMGERHTGYGVKPHHYKAVGEALLWTLSQGLGSDWTPELRDAWTAVYEDLASQMLQGASAVKQ